MINKLKQIDIKNHTCYYFDDIIKIEYICKYMFHNIKAHIWIYAIKSNFTIRVMYVVWVIRLCEYLMNHLKSLQILLPDSAVVFAL